MSARRPVRPPARAPRHLYCSDRLLARIPFRHHRGFLGDHEFEALEVGHQRRLIEHAHLAQHWGALAEAARVIGADDVIADAYQLWEALRDDAEEPSIEPAGHGVEHHHSRAAAGRGYGMAERAFQLTSPRYQGGAPSIGEGV